MIFALFYRDFFSFSHTLYSTPLGNFCLQIPLLPGHPPIRSTRLLPPRVRVYIHPTFVGVDSGNVPAQGRYPGGKMPYTCFHQKSTTLANVPEVTVTLSPNNICKSSFIPRSLFYFIWFLIYSVCHYCTCITFAFVICFFK